MTISGDGGYKTESPECRPSRYGLNSVANIVERSDSEWAKGLEFDQLPCSYDPGIVSGQCPPLPEQHKTAARGFDTITSDAFAIYAGWECSTLSGGAEQAWDNADKLLERNWWRSIERAMWTGLDQDDNEIRETLGTAEVTDLTPEGGPLDVTAGVAVLESFFGDCSDCLPIIHANRGLATFFAERNLVRPDGEDLRFVGTGSLAAVGAGYSSTGPGGQVADPGTAWMYITGGVTVTHGPRFFAPERGDLAGAVDRSINDIRVFAERFVAIQIDCCIGAVQVSLNSCCC